MESDNETLVKDIQNSFLNLLNDHLPKNVLEKAKDRNIVKVMSICCGRFREAKSIFDYFSDYKDSIKVYGIEIDKNLLDLAKNERIIKENEKSVCLKLGDASSIESYKDWLEDGLFDLVIVRHPEITFNTDVFVKIFSLSYKNLLAKNSYLIITTHFENEKETLKLLLKALKLNVLVDIENDLAPCIKEEEKNSYADRFLLIASL